MRLQSFVITTVFLAGLLLSGCAASGPMSTSAPAEKAAATAPTAHVQSLIDMHQLDMVDFDYVEEAIGNGTRKGARALLIDARPNNMYLSGTIPSSLSIPDTQIEKYIGQLDGVAMDKEILVFCGGWGCEKSPIVAGYLKDKGYKNVKLYQAGEPEWKKKSYLEVGIPIVESVLKKDSALLMDARPRLMYLAETIPGSMYMNDTELDKLASRFPADKATPIIAYCGGYACGKSHAVAKELLARGYSDVKVFAGGLPEWKKAGMQTTASAKVAKDEAAPKGPTMVDGVKTGADEGTVDGEWFYALFKDGKVPANVALVDVRNAEEYASGHLRGAMNVPAGKMSAQELVGKLPKDRVSIFVCGSGARAMEAYYKVKDENLDASKLLYFDANIECQGTDCEIEVNEPLG
jgi:rhodanese-related sulfurtransferase